MVDEFHDGKRCSICSLPFEVGDAISEQLVEIRYNMGFEYRNRHILIRYHPECKLEEAFH